MLTQMTVLSRKHTRETSVVPWWSQVPYLKERQKFQFAPGMNILWGPNGSGKSTLIAALTRTLCCDQGGTMTVTQHAVHELFNHKWFGDVPDMSEEEKARRTFKRAFQVDHDGQVMSFTGKAVGLIGGAAFDDDFFSQGLANVMFKGSAGQTMIHRLYDVLQAFQGGKVPEIRDALGDRLNSLWSARKKVLMESLQPTIDPGPPTIILDEPDRSLDIPNQVALWSILRDMSEKFQILVATHSLFALRYAPEDTNWIEFQEGYLDKCRQTLAAL